MKFTIFHKQLVNSFALVFKITFRNYSVSKWKISYHAAEKRFPFVSMQSNRSVLDSTYQCFSYLVHETIRILEEILIIAHSYISNPMIFAYQKFEFEILVFDWIIQSLITFFSHYKFGNSKTIDHIGEHTDVMLAALAIVDHKYRNLRSAHKCWYNCNTHDSHKWRHHNRNFVISGFLHID